MTALGAAAAGTDMVERCVAGSCKGSRKEVARAPGTLVFYRPGRQVQGEPNSAVLSPTRGTPARYQGRGRPGWARHAWPTCRRLCGRAGSVRTQAAAGQETQQGGAPALPGARHRTALAGNGGGMLLHQGLLCTGGVSRVSGMPHLQCEPLTTQHTRPLTDKLLQDFIEGQQADMLNTNSNLDSCSFPS